jgi:hypothetical protein
MVAKPQTEKEKKHNREAWGRIARALNIDPAFSQPMDDDEIEELWEGITIGGQVVHQEEPARAPDDVLHATYSALLESLTLSEPHAKWLAKRGFDSDQCLRIGYRSSPTLQEACRLAQPFRKVRDVPGLTHDMWLTRLDAILIPIRDRAGRVVAVKQRIMDGGKDRMRLLGGGGSKARQVVHHPVGTTIKRGTQVLFTEGERKGDFAHLCLSYPSVISIPGVRCWSMALDECVEAGHVLLAMDQDEAGRDCTGRLGRALTQLGVKVDVLVWDKGKGVDDFTRAGGSAQTFEWEEVAAQYQDSRVEEDGDEQQDNLIPPTKSTPFVKGQKLRDHEIIPYVAFFQPVLRNEMGGYCYLISQMIRDGRLKMEKGSQGQILSIPDTKPST